VAVFENYLDNKSEILISDHG